MFSRFFRSSNLDFLDTLGRLKLKWKRGAHNDYSKELISQIFSKVCSQGVTYSCLAIRKVFVFSHLRRT